MGRGNIAMGTLRGKVGDLVFTRLNGKQVVKSRNRQPMNKRTVIQQTHRAKIAACIRFFAMAVQNLFRFAYEDKRRNETDMNVFIRHNYDKVVPLTKYALDQNCPVLAPFQLTNGSLTSVPYQWGYGLVQSASKVSDIEYPAVVFSTDIASNFNSLTQGKVSKALIDEFGCKNGDILTYLVISLQGKIDAYSPSAEEQAMSNKSLITNWSVPRWEITQFRIDVDSTTLLRQVPGIFNADRSADDAGNVVPTWALELGKRQGRYGHEYVETETGTLSKIMFTALIHSRYEGGKTTVSTEYLKGSEVGSIFDSWAFLKNVWPEFCGRTWSESNVAAIAPANILQGSEVYGETADMINIDIFSNKAATSRPMDGATYLKIYLKISGQRTWTENVSYDPVGQPTGEPLEVVVGTDSSGAVFVRLMYNRTWVTSARLTNTIEAGIYEMTPASGQSQGLLFRGKYFSYRVPKYD